MSNVQAVKRFLRSRFPAPYYALKSTLAGVTPEQNAAAQRFLDMLPAQSRPRYHALIRRMYDVQDWVPCEHTHDEMFQVVAAIARTPTGTEGVVVEAGCFKGGSAAKLSHACAMHKRKLVLFDSFEGIPPNEEIHEKRGLDRPVTFNVGAYTGSLEHVQDNIRRYGRIDVCSFKKGWFDDTMPGFDKPIIAAYVDVDLASSTRTCMKYLYPLLAPGGVIFSQDGHLSLVVDVLKDPNFWQNDVGVPMPYMTGLGTQKLVGIYKNRPAA
jgi:O-methyltransferase